MLGRHKTKIIFLLLGSGLFSSLAYAIAETDATHDELRHFKDEVITAINAHNMDQLSPLLNPNVVLTLETGKTLRTQAGAIQFFKNLFTGPNKQLSNFKVNNVQVAEKSTLYGNNIAISFGSADSYYEFTNGQKQTLPSHWTATLVKEGPNWQIASYQNTVNFADNPYLTKVKLYGYVYGVAGILIGLVGGMLLRKKSSTTPVLS